MTRLRWFPPLLALCLLASLVEVGVPAPAVGYDAPAAAAVVGPLPDELRDHDLAGPPLPAAGEATRHGGAPVEDIQPALWPAAATAYEIRAPPSAPQ
jgi:hypothetical protein